MKTKGIKKIDLLQSRYAVMDCLSLLADFRNQVKTWINPKFKHAFSDSIAVCSYDEMIGWPHLDEKAYERIGIYIYDEEEAESIQNYCKWFHKLYVYTIGECQPDEAYYKHAEWPNVVKGALEVRKIMARKNYENGFWRQFDKEFSNEAHNEIYKHHLQLADEGYLEDLEVLAPAYEFTINEMSEKPGMENIKEPLEQVKFVKGYSGFNYHGYKIGTISDNARIVKGKPEVKIALKQNDYVILKVNNTLVDMYGNYVKKIEGKGIYVEERAAREQTKILLKNKIKKVQAVQSRFSLMSSLDYLADYDLQIKTWIDPIYKHAFSDSIAFNAYDNLIGWEYLHEEAYEHIGIDIYDEEEAESIQNYCKWFHKLYVYTIGECQPDEAYYKHAEWPNVVKGALEVRKIMARKNYENGFWRQHFEENREEYDENNKCQSQLKEEKTLSI